MFSVKKIILSFLIVSLLFLLGNKFLPQTVQAATTDLHVYTVIDADNDHAYNFSDDPCYVGRVNVKVNSNPLRAFNTSATNCVGNFTGQQETPYLLTLTNPTNVLSFIKISDKYGAKTYARDLGRRHISVSPGNGASVVIFGLVGCVRKDPTISLIRNDSGSNNRTYTLKLKNNDSASCTSRSFNLSTASLNSNWDAKFLSLANNRQITSINVSPGPGESFKLQVTPPQGASTTTFYAVAKAGTNEKKYSLTYNITPQATKDLKITAFNFPGGVDTGTSDPTITIKNIGNTQITDNFNVKVENKQNHTGASQIWNVTQDVSANETISHTFSNLPRPAAGDYTALATVDSGNAISESNENNNTATDTYTTTRPSPSSNPTNTPTPTNRPNPTCDRNLPGLEITPANRDGNPGDKKTYDVKVTNNDTGSGCDPVTFVLSKERLPGPNWDGRFDNNRLEDVPKAGGSKSTTYHVKSPVTANAGQKTITVGVRRQAQERAQKTVNVTYTVQISDTPSPTPAPSGTPTITPTPTLTPSGEPTGEPTPTIFPDNGLLKVKLGVDGIGKTPRIPIGGNQNPIDPDKNFTLGLYSTSENTLTEGWDDWTFTYNTTSQKFENELGLSNDFPTGTYNAYIEGGGYIRARYPGSVTITKGQTTVIDSDNFYVIAGNLNNEDTSENRIDIMDYMVLNSCWIYSQDYSLCDQNPNYKVLSDLNNDGTVNEDDYTLFLKEYGNEGAPLP